MERTVGVEVELSRVTRGRLDPCLFPGWRTVADRSIPRPTGEQGAELLSPPLQLSELQGQVRYHVPLLLWRGAAVDFGIATPALCAYCSWLELYGPECWGWFHDGEFRDYWERPGAPKLGHRHCTCLGEAAPLVVRPDRTSDAACCGLHVHVDSSDLSDAQVAVLLLLYSRYQREIQERWIPSWRRDTVWGSDLPSDFSGYAGEPITLEALYASGMAREKYSAVNLLPRLPGGYGTVEFRQGVAALHEGDYPVETPPLPDADHINGWAAFVAALVEECAWWNVGPRTLMSAVVDELPPTLDEFLADSCAVSA